MAVFACILPLFIPVLFLLLLSAPSAVVASSANDDGSSPPPSVTTSIRGTLRLPDPDGPALNMTRVTLNDGSRHSTYTRPDGSFVFHRVPPGVHLLDVQSREHHFSQVKIQLLAEAMDTPKCIEYVFPGAPKQAVPHPLELVAHASYEYFEPQQGFSVLGIFKNPMMLMMIVSLGGMMLMPKMMEGLDPDQKEQMQRQMAMQQDPSKMLTQMFQDMTGTGEEPEPQKVERKASSKAGGKTTRRGKRD
ncbi:hypothetical protein ACHAWF_016701 [Thalassiosira exigua]